MTLNVTDFVNIKRSVLFIVFICFSFVIAQDTQDFEMELYDFFQFEDSVENPVSEEMNQIMNPDFKDKKIYCFDAESPLGPVSCNQLLSFKGTIEKTLSNKRNKGFIQFVKKIEKEYETVSYGKFNVYFDEEELKFEFEICKNLNSELCEEDLIIDDKEIIPRTIIKMYDRKNSYILIAGVKSYLNIIRINENYYQLNQKDFDKLYNMIEESLNS